MGDAILVDETEKKGLKRKREKQKFEGLTPEERNAWAKSLNEELESLKRYFNEVMNWDVGLESHFSSVNTSLNGMIAVLLEEKSAPYSKLVSEIYERLKEREGGVTIATVKSSVLYVGQRVAYGISSPDVDVLEDETESSLWCWETRDMKFLPRAVRGVLKTRRVCRKKISERITAILDVISSLRNPEGHLTYMHDMMKAADKLCKALAEADIRNLVESLAQKRGSEMAEKEAKRKSKEAEKEKKKMDRELQKEKLQSEKDKKRLQQETEKDVKRREKEESEVKKPLKRKQEEAEREQRRREKEEAELKKQRSVQKQASMMERFLKRSKTNITLQNDQALSTPVSDTNFKSNGTAPESVSLHMDSALQQKNEFDVEEIRKSHMNSWRCLGHSIRSNKQHWGMRQKPKTQLIKELKLTSNKESAREDDLCIDSVVDGWEQTSNNDKSCPTKTSASSTVTRKDIRRKQLLQFDKSYRPAFYGIWPKKSTVVGPRHPLKKDPDLEYDIDSDEEWEEEEPGESLSDSEKEEEETLDEGSLKADGDEESEDGFFVPDGYLSENEGVETDRNQNNVAVDVIDSAPSGKPEAESEEYSGWIRQQKYLHKLTEHALKKNQPLIIVNLMHEKAQLLTSEDLTGSLKVEQLCLQALAMRAFPGGLSIELPSDNSVREENQEVSTPGATGAAAASLSDSELREMVSAIQKCGQGMNRVLESLQQRFPAISKSQLRSKVREMSDFVDNRWKVKKEILHKLGMSISPEKTGGRTKSIATFFSKRCLPPSGHGNPCEYSPESLKPGSISNNASSTENAQKISSSLP